VRATPSEVGTGIGVLVTVGEGVEVLVAVAVDVRVAVGDAVGVADGVAVRVIVADGVAVRVGVAVAVAVGLTVGVWVAVTVGLTVGSAADAAKGVASGSTCVPVDLWASRPHAPRMTITTRAPNARCLRTRSYRGAPISLTLLQAQIVAYRPGCVKLYGTGDYPQVRGDLQSSVQSA